MSSVNLPNQAALDEPLITERLALSGLTCAGCAGRVERALAAVPGVVSAEVNLVHETASVRAPSGITSEALIAAVTAAGYGATKPDAPGASEIAKGASSFWKEGAHAWGAALLTAPLLVPMLLKPFGVHVMLPAWAELTLAAPVQFFFGARFYRGAWSALRAKSANMDVLVALGTSAAFGLSLLLMARGGHLYFESAAAVITFVLLGKWLESRAKLSTTAAVRALIDLRPTNARLRVGESEHTLRASDVQEGDVLVVRPGEQVPADGQIIEGESSLNESLITGESLPVRRGPGERVIGGSVNTDGLLVIRATDVAEASLLGRIATLVQDAQGKKAPVMRKVDKISAIFVPVVLALSVLSFLGWLLTGVGPEAALIHAVSVLVIACPCALGLATPAALAVGMGRAAGEGILIQDVDALERAQATTTVVFDKTGTLTEGTPSLSHIIGERPDEVLMLAGAAQQGSEHPLAQATRDALKARGLSPPPSSNFRAHAGRGVEAQTRGALIRVGSPRWMNDCGLSLAPLQAEAQLLEKQGLTVTWVSHASTIIGALALGDAVRPSAKRAVQRLQEAGIQTLLLTGDSSSAAQAVAAEVGISTVKSEVRPDEKAAEVERLKSEGQVIAMVGDGVNDAPALATADVGIAMGSGSDVALLTAGVTLLRPDPKLVMDAISISRATTKKIHQNLFWAFAYNVIGLPLAALGYLTPIAAGAAMALSSVSVLTSALWLNRWKPGE